MPGLTIRYSLTTLGTGARQDGLLSPIVRENRAHYVVDTKLIGPGWHRLALRVRILDWAGSGRHVDSETKVPAGWDPVDVAWTFSYPRRDPR
jgi:uncharacterized protein involved in high-affinity Fe2+ transport